MRPIRSISVLMPTWQGAEFLDRVLASLAAQESSVPWDFRVVDSGSTDETLAILERWRARFPVPFAVERIHQVEFDHGDTRNRLAARSSGEILVFLTQDAIPQGPQWLARLAGNFDDPAVGAAYCRNVPRPDARVLTRVFSAGDPGYRAESETIALPAPAAYAALTPHQKRVLFNFNDVASAVRRELWERHPFPRTWFGEDVLMARALLEGGWKIAYDAQATVEHSHDYDASETRARALVDGRFNAEWLGHLCVAHEADTALLVERLAAEDRAALLAEGLSGERLEAECSRAVELRRAAFTGLYEGGRSPVRQPATRMLAEPSLHVLYVLHGFPPDTWAGTEVYTLNLARAMQARGHRVTVLARAPAVGDEPDFALRETEFEGLRVVRMTHRLQHASIRESYVHPGAEEAFRAVLERERPDVVHFQHLIHLSVGCVGIAQALSLPTVVHLHDYWAVCPRVQLIRPDGERCAHERGAGCHLCVHERALGQIERLERLGREAPAVVDLLAAGSHPRRERAGPRWDGLADLLARKTVVGEAYRSADLRISPSRFLRDLLVQTAGFDPHTTIFSDNGMRTDTLGAQAPAALGAQTPVLGATTDGFAAEAVERPAGAPLRVGFVGTLVWYKGDAVLLRAMRRLVGRPIELHVWGDFRPQQDPEHARLAALAPSNVHFRGRFDNARLAAVYAELDVLCVPSVWYENSPVTIHEAFLFETPVVASRLGGMAEYVREGIDGLCFEPGDDEDLARVLVRFLDEPGLAAELARDFAPLKTIAEDAADMEYRYRRLACVDRTPRPVCVLDRAGCEHDAARGPVERQGADFALLRPGASIELALCAPGRAENGRARPGRELVVEVAVFALAAERKVWMGGMVFADDAPLGRIEPFRAEGADETRTFSFTLDAGAEPARLRVESWLPGRSDSYLRIARIRVLERSAMPVGVG